MTLSARNQDIVQRLTQAWRSGQPWTAHNFDENLSLDDAYAIQAGVAQTLGWFPEGPKAWKAGGKTQVTAAPLPEVLRSPAAWPIAQDEVVIEAELAFRLARTPSSAQDIAACLGTVCVSIEIIATRITGGLAAPANWKLADQGLHAGLVIGTERPYAPYAAFTREDWARQNCGVWVNGAVVTQTQGTHPSGDPLSALLWLYAHAATNTGGLRAGDLVTTGAWIVETVRTGDTVDVEFEGFDAARVQITG